MNEACRFWRRTAEREGERERERGREMLISTKFKKGDNRG